MRAKKRSLLISASVLCVILLGAVVFCLVTSGRVSERDGLLQCSRIYMENAHVESGTLYFTMANHSLRKFEYDSWFIAEIQKKSESGWEKIVYTYPEGLGNKRQDVYIPAFLQRFSETEGMRSLLNEEMQPGEYRFFVRGTMNNEDVAYIVGYYTIPKK